MRFCLRRNEQGFKFDERTCSISRKSPNNALPEADRSDMEDFIARLQVVLPVLGIQFIRPTPNLSKMPNTRAKSNATDLSESSSRLIDDTNYGATALTIQSTADGEKSPIFKFSSRDVKANAVEVGGQMIVLAGSRARSEELPSLASNVRTYREQLKRSGKLVSSTTNGILEFPDDVVFTSPSAAAQAVMGTSRNGRTDWIVESTGQTYAKWQESENHQDTTPNHSRG